MGEVRTYSLPAPEEGLNLVSALNRLTETEALELKNLYPEDGVLKKRNGFTTYVSTITKDRTDLVTSLNLADGTSKMVFATGGEVFTETGGTPSSLGTGSLDAWQTTTFNYKLFAVNGTNAPWYWDGAAGSFTSTGFTGVTQSDLINVSVYKERLYFVEKNSGSIWYAGSKAITGALTEFNAEFVMKLGGFVVMCGSYSNNSANNLQSLFYFLTSEGELFFYTGLNPGDSEWQQVARHEIGRPLGYRSSVEVENDVIFITDKGLVPCSALFQGDPSTALLTIGRKVNKVIRDAAQSISFSHLWGGLFWSGGSRLFISVPENGQVKKFLVCNLQRGAWCIYEYNNNGTSLGLCHSFGFLDGHPYAGCADGRIIKLEDGQMDAGDISISLKYGHQLFGKHSYKRISEIRPLIFTNTGVTITVGVYMDYQNQRDAANITTTGVSTLWNSPWGSQWATPQETKFDWYALNGSGTVGSLSLSGEIGDVPFEIYQFDLTIEDGARR